MIKLIDMEKNTIKRINNLNQDAKIMFDNFYIGPSGFIYPGNDKFQKLLKGHHIAIAKDNPFNDLHLILNADHIYTTIKDNKKDLKNIYLDNTEIGFIGENKYPFGRIISESRSMKYINNDGFELDLNKYNRLTDKDVQSLVKNGMMELEDGDYRTRITREVIPGAKFTTKILTEVYYMFKENEINYIYELHLACVKENITSFHMYKCYKR